MIAEWMKAVVLTGHGGPDRLEYRDVRTPAPGRGDVLIRVGACGLNNTDINTRTAWYSKAVDQAVGDGARAGFAEAEAGDGTWGSGAIRFPLIQGADVAGRIAAVGEDVDPARLGERVLVDPWLLGEGDWQNPENSGYFGSEEDGGFAQYTVVRAGNAVAIDSPLSDAELATFPCAWTTAENLVQRTAPRPGETVVITGASGGVGTAALQLCRLRGCRVIAVASPEKEGVLRELGADCVIDRRTDDLEGEIQKAGKGAVDIALDVVGGPMFLPLLRALKQGGRYSTSGCIAGAASEIDLRLLVYKDLQLTGATICPPGTMQRVVRLIESGAVQPVLAGEYPLEDLAKAQEDFLSKRHIGSLVVVP